MFRRACLAVTCLGGNKLSKSNNCNMSKTATALFTTGKKLGYKDELYLISVFDLEPSGITVQAYNQNDSTEYLLSITEMELASSGYTRSAASLMTLIDTMYLVDCGQETVLQSTCDKISKTKLKPSAEYMDKLLSEPLIADGDSLNELLVKGLVELCKCKPVGLNAAEWLGTWLLANNPNMPRVDVPDEE